MRLVERSETTINGRHVVLEVTPIGAWCSIGHAQYQHVTYASVKRIRRVVFGRGQED